MVSTWEWIRWTVVRSISEGTIIMQFSFLWIDYVFDGSIKCHLIILCACVRKIQPNKIHCLNLLHNKSILIVTITVKSCIKAAAYVQFFNFLVRLLFKCGFYLRAAYMQSPESAKPVKAAWHMENESETWHCDCSKIMSYVSTHLACEKR